MKLLIIKKLFHPHCNKAIFIMKALFIINHRVMTSKWHYKQNKTKAMVSVCF